MDCIFCKIIAGEIPGNFLYRDEDLAAFRDVNPIAPTHVLIVPTKHIPSLLELSDADLPLMSKMVKVGNELARKEGIAERGYRLVINCGKEGTQLVHHLHMHLLGGKQLSGRIG
ncbi:MAG: histidine triad nucleotide-binding protein [Chloroflexi bacterium RBG_16_57_8]|nr:MAG: histidine triad nucleotide-binding protein [Chloroflexi bacterium RBG_16_57_8]